MASFNLPLAAAVGDASAGTPLAAPAATTAAAVGGAGTGVAWNVPVAAATLKTVSVLAFQWALHPSFGNAVEAAGAFEPAAMEIVNRLTITLEDGMDFTPAEAAARLEALRDGNVEGMLRLERQYTAHFEPLREPRALMAAALAAGKTMPEACPLAAGWDSSPQMTVALAAALLAVPESVVVRGAVAIAAAAEALAPATEQLARVFAGFEARDRIAAAALHKLAVSGLHALPADASAAVRAYVDDFQSVCAFRGTVTAALRQLAAAKPLLLAAPGGATPASCRPDLAIPSGGGAAAVACSQAAAPARHVAPATDAAASSTRLACAASRVPFATPPAAVGGAGTGPAWNVPVAAGTALNVPAAPEETVSALALDWLLSEAVSEALGALGACMLEAQAVAARVVIELADCDAFTPAACVARLKALRSGQAEASTDCERQYVALFAPFNAARSRLVAAVCEGVVSHGPPRPSVAAARGGRRWPVAAAAKLLAMEEHTVIRGSELILEAIEAAEAGSSRLDIAYDGLEMTPDDARLRLRTLALIGADGLPGLVTRAERAYAGHFEHARTFRQAVAAALAPVPPLPPVPALPNASVHAAPVGGSVAPTTTLLSGIRVHTLRAHTRSVTTLAVLPDGRLASASEDNTIKLWDATAGLCVATLEGHSGVVRALTLLTDGRLASCGDDCSVRVWDLASASCSTVLRGHVGPIHLLAALPDGLLASGGDGPMIWMWNVTTATLAAHIRGHKDTVTALLALPDGRLASGSRDNTVALWDPKTAARGWITKIKSRNGPVTHLAAISATLLASGNADGTVALWDAVSRKYVGIAAGHSSAISSLAVLPRGRVATGDVGGTVKVWAPATGVFGVRCITETVGHSGAVTALTVLPDDHLVTGGGDAKVRVWRLQSEGGRGAVLAACAAQLDGLVGAVTALALLPDGRLACGSADATVRVWNV